MTATHPIVEHPSAAPTRAGRYTRGSRATFRISLTAEDYRQRDALFPSVRSIEFGEDRPFAHIERAEILPIVDPAVGSVVMVYANESACLAVVMLGALYWFKPFAPDEEDDKAPTLQPVRVSDSDVVTFDAKVWRSRGHLWRDSKIPRATAINATRIQAMLDPMESKSAQAIASLTQDPKVRRQWYEIRAPANDKGLSTGQVRRALRLLGRLGLASCTDDKVPLWGPT